MTDDHHGWTAGRATPLVRAADEILGTHSIAWAVMRYDADYTDAGADYYEKHDQRNREHLVRYHQNALARLGLQVTVTAPGDGAPPSPAPDNPGQAA